MTTVKTWSKRIRDLQALGLTQREIGLLVGLSATAVSDIANSPGMPRGRAAVNLHALHKRLCPQQAAEIESEESDEDAAQAG